MEIWMRKWTHDAASLTDSVAEVAGKARILCATYLAAAHGLTRKPRNSCLALPATPGS